MDREIADERRNLTRMRIGAEVTSPINLPRSTIREDLGEMRRRTTMMIRTA